MASKLTPKLTLSDLRAESAFNASIAPAGSNKSKVAFLILKTQVVYPFVQGFAWAVLKDWLVVFRLFASSAGRRSGLQFRAWLSQWLQASFARAA